MLSVTTQSMNGALLLPMLPDDRLQVSPDGTVAWFDELLDNANYGETRGSGVLRLSDGNWRISQYHLTIPVPNSLADTVVTIIRGQAAR